MIARIRTLDATREPHGLGRRPEPEFVPDVAAIEAWQRRQERTRVAYARDRREADRP